MSQSATISDKTGAQPLAGERAARLTRDATLRRLLCVADSVAVLVALTLALVIPGRPGAGDRLLWGLFAIPLFGVLFKLYGLYDRDVKRISHSTVDDLSRIIHAVVIGGLLLWLYSKYTPLHRLDFAEIGLFGVALVCLALALRALVRGVASRVIGLERALLIGTGSLAQALVHNLASHREYGLRVIGSLAPPSAETAGDRRSAAIATDELDESDSNSSRRPVLVGPRAVRRRVQSVPILGALDELEELAVRHRVSRVILSTTAVDDHELERLLRRCRGLALKVSVLPRLSDMLGPTVEIDDVAGITVLGLSMPALSRSSHVVKRITDLAVASTLLLLLTPLMLLTALAIKLDSRGPVLYAQERVGRKGRRFRLFKFRTMVLEADRRHAELLAFSTDPHWLKLEDDPRVTRVGRRLRRFSIDELPQLWNVLRGEMSIVGPRPLIPLEDELVHDWGRQRLDLTPGLTGYWQVLGRSRIPFEEMVKLDYLYVMNWSVWQDVRLMLKTVPAVLSGRGRSES